MIIRGVSAERFLRYERLELSGLPERGVIGVSGHNESGKTTIGEAICFGLFGRTFGLTEEEVVKAIRWGETDCEVDVDFRVDGKGYRVLRRMDDRGHQGVELLGDGGESLGRGVEMVSEVLGEILGFGYEEFVDSFYLSQREQSEPHAQAVKSMAGVSVLERVAEKLVQKNSEDRESLGESERAREELEQERDSLGVDPKKLGELEGEQSRLSEEVESKEKAIEGCEAQMRAIRGSVVELNASAEGVLTSEIGTSYLGWRARLGRFEQGLERIEAVSKGEEEVRDAVAGVKSVVGETLTGLEAFGELEVPKRRHRGRLASLLGEGSQDEALQGTEEGFAERERVLGGERSVNLSRLTASRWGLWVSVIVAVLSWIVWGLVEHVPDSGLSAWLNESLADYRALLLPAAVVMSVVSLLLVASSVRLSGQRSELVRRTEALAAEREAARDVFQALDGLESMGLPDAVTLLQGIDNEALRTALERFLEGPGTVLVHAEALAGYHERVQARLTGYETAAGARCETLTEEVASIRHEQSTQRDALSTLDPVVAEELARRAQDEQLRRRGDDYQIKIDDATHRIAVRELAQELIAGACRHLSAHFNEALRKLVGQTLPLFTQGRYEHLHLDEHLTVRVFSSVKRDFIDLDEASSGTQRQILLAVRLALSQALGDTTRGGEQCLILDEPFAFFDQQRMQATLETLPKLDQTLAQIWLIAQDFPPDTPFASHIQCSTENDRLVFSAG